jgi:hypothetical protein
MANSTQLAARLIRSYSQRIPKDNSNYAGLKGYALTGYLCAAFVVPFVPPYLASKRTKQDGTYLTRLVLLFNLPYDLERNTDLFGVI